MSILAETLLAAKRLGIESNRIKVSRKLQWIAKNGRLELCKASIDRRTAKITIYPDAIRARDEDIIEVLEEVVQHRHEHARHAPFNEEDHPRDEHGRWTDAGGGGEIDTAKVEAKTKTNVAAASAKARAKGVKPLDGSRAEHPATIASRNPTGKGATGAYGQPDVASMKLDPKRFEHDIGLFRNADFYPNFRAKDLADTADQSSHNVVNEMKDNLKFLYQFADKHTQVWYDGARALVDDRVKLFGFNDASIAAVYAALSPTKDWDQNVHIADMLMKTYKNQQGHRWDSKMDDKSKTLWSAKNQKVVDLVRGKTLGELTSPAEKALWIRTYDETHGKSDYRSVLPNGAMGPTMRNKDGAPAKVVWQSLASMTNAVKALEANGDSKIISDAMGTAHKVRSFYNNILDPHSANGDVTIDTHAVGAALLRQLPSSSVAVAHNFGNTPMKVDQPEGWEAAGSSVKTGLSGLYPVYAQAYREAAKELGIQPRQLQSAVWVVKREAFGDAPKKTQDAIEALWHEYHDNPKVTLADTQQAIAKLVGLKNERSYRDDEKSWRSGDARKLYRDGVGFAAADMDSGAGNGVAGRAARLDAVRSEGWRVGAEVAKEFNEEDHPRDEDGKFTFSGGGSDSGGDSGSAGVEFVSPNVASHLDFSQAVSAIKGEQQRQLKDASEFIDKGLGIEATHYDIIGAWADGAENSVASVIPTSKWDNLRVAAAMKGYIADQKSVLVFQQAGYNEGTEAPERSVLYSFEAKGKLEDIHKGLLEDGVGFHTLVPSKDGKSATVLVVDMDGTAASAVEKASGRYDTQVEVRTGRAEFIGTVKEDGTDREQRDSARASYAALIEQSKVQGSQETWRSVRDRWGTAEVSAIKGLPADIIVKDRLIEQARERGAWDITAKALPKDEYRSGRTRYNLEIKAKIPKGIEQFVNRPGDADRPDRIAYYNPKLAKLETIDEGVQYLERTYARPLPGLSQEIAPLPEKDIIYRGMRAEEYEKFLQTGEIVSTGTYNLEGQEGLTYWATDPSTAISYANGFAPWPHKATFEKPAYVVATKMPKETRHVPGVGENEVGVARAITKDEIVGVWRGDVFQHMSGDQDIAPISYDLSESVYRAGSGSSPSSDVVWRRQDGAKKGFFKEFNEEDHPRDEDGKFTFGGGGESTDSSSGSDSKTPASDLLAKHHDDSIHTFADVEAKLSPAFKLEAKKAEDEMSRMEKTDIKYKAANGKYTPERSALHRSIVRGMFTPEVIAAATPKAGEKPVLTLSGGRTGAGKTSSLKTELSSKLKTSVFISSDDIQEKLPGYDGAHAAIYNAEAQDIALQAEKVARFLGLNIIYDATLKSKQPALDRVKNYKDAGYDVDGYFVHTTPVTSALRAADRFMSHTGRYVPPIIAFNMKTNEATFDSLIPHLRNWALYDNNGSKPVRVTGGHNG